MWGLLEKITTQVTNFSSTPGQVWYILVFGYRLVVITSLGGSVYGDEQGAFQCSVQVTGCENMCYNAFAKISHLRFWAFQLIAISTPTIFFHFYSLHVQSLIEKIKETEKALKSLETGELVARDDNGYGEGKMEKDVRKLPRRRNQVGKFKIKEVYRGTEKKEIPHTRKIKIAFIISLLIRLGVEMLFTWFGFQLFNIQNEETSDSSLKTFLWMRVPALYRCRDNGDEDLRTACGMHMQQNGYVPCFVSRPYEKTVFLRYMNILSFVCMVITLFEVLQSLVRQCRNKSKSKCLNGFQLKAMRKKSPGFDVEQQLQVEPPSFETAMKKYAYGNDRGIYNKGNIVAAPASPSLFECVSVEELEKQRDLKSYSNKRRLKGNKEKQAEAPPYESDDSLNSRM